MGQASILQSKEYVDKTRALTGELNANDPQHEAVQPPQNERRECALTHACLPFLSYRGGTCMSGFGAKTTETPPRIGIVRSLLALMAVFGFGFLLILPLAWKEQAILGAALIGAALLLDRTSHSAIVTLMLMTVSIFSTLRYGYYRVIQTYEGITSSGHLHQWDTVFVIILLLAEFYAFITLVLGYFQTLRPLRRRPVPLAGNPRHWPTVDVFIPTYNEPLSVVRATILGALALDYPNDKLQVIVLDDGRRKEFRDFAARVGVRYLTRNENAHAKAGNINHALRYTDGEYVGVPQRMINIACLGMRVHVACDVTHANSSRKIAELFAPSIIEYDYLQLVVRIIKSECSKDSCPYYAKRLIVRRYKNVHRGPVSWITSQGHRTAPERAKRLKISKYKRDECVEFRKQEDDDENRIPLMEMPGT